MALTRADELNVAMGLSALIWAAVVADLAAVAAATGAGASTLTHSDGYFGFDDDDDAGVIVRIDVGVVRIFDGDDVVIDADVAAASAA